MVVPNRRYRMVERAIQNQERAKKEGMKELNEKKVSSKEHEERIEMLKKMGLLKTKKED